MIANFTHYLTLASFLTHVLLGCCAHHGHLVSTAKCCEKHSAADGDFKHCASGEHCNGPCGHLPANEPIDGSDAASDAASDFVFVEVGSDVPLEQGHGPIQCVHGRCTYVFAASVSVPDSSAVDIYILPLMDSPDRIRLVGDDSSNFGRENVFRSVTATERCAHLHSWQL